jgi:ACT domain-containing protein
MNNMKHNFYIVDENFVKDTEKCISIKTILKNTKNVSIHDDIMLYIWATIK